MPTLISEFQPNPSGADPSTMTIELSGTAGEAFTGSFLSIENDGINGTVDRLSTVSGTFDANGLLTVEIPDLENPSFTVVLTDGTETVSQGDDLDADDDGTIDDIASLGTVLDAIGIADNGSDAEVLYSAQLGGTDFGFTNDEPRLVFRSGSTGDLFAVNDPDGGEVFDVTGTAVDVASFDVDPTAGTDTFGAINPIFGTDPVDPPAEADFTLELLHIADQEGATGAIIDAPNLSAVVSALQAQDLGDDGVADNSLFLSSGDAIIPGVFFAASENVFGAAGIADIQIQNELGIQAIALGNHEFDTGPDSLAALIDGSAGEGNTILGADFTGADMPYLSANLDFTGEASLAALEVVGGGAPLANTVTSSVVIDVNGENIGVVGATTPTLAAISSPGGVLASPQPFDGTPTDEQLDALSAEIQFEVDALRAADPALNKIVLLAHMQRLDIELGLAERLVDVDIIVAGGSNTRLFDDNDRARDGDSDQGQYPQFVTNAGGTSTAVVNTDGSYKYVGRLVLDFDVDGNIIPESYDEEVSGAFATDAQGVADLGAEGLVDPEIQQIVDAIEAEIILAEGNVFGISDVFLNGNRSGVTDDAADTDGVRTQETNLGNLTADANLAAAQDSDETVLVSIKNGGGIRANIGETVVLPGDTEATRLPNGELLDGDGNIIKPEGGISQNDIQTTLAFNNDLVLMTVTKEELVGLLEHGIDAIPGVSGRFPQIAGLKFSYDETRDSGDKIVNAGIFDDAGELVMELVRNAELSGDPATEIRIVTLGFLAAPRFDDEGNFTGGGDGYPFPNTNNDPELGEVGPDAARINLVELEEEGVQTGDATFADNGTEQDALAEYLDDNFNPDNGGTAFAEADAGRDTDARIQNLSFREDEVFEDNLPDTPVATGEVTFSIAAEFQGEGEDGDPDGASEVVAHENGVLYVTNGTNDRIDIFQLPDGTSMLRGEDGWSANEILTVGETLTSTGALNDLNSPEAGYTPPGVLDGLGATELDEGTVRVFANHELLHFRGNSYELSDGEGGTYSLIGARISYFDIDKETRQIVDSGIAYNTIVDANGDIASDATFQPEPFATFFGGGAGDGAPMGGLSRLCSGILHEAGEFGEGMGIDATIYFAGEEDGSGFNSVGGAEWALDVATGTLYQVPAMGRGGWENITQIDTGTTSHVAFILSDDSSPFDVDDFDADQVNGDAEDEAAPLFMYVGEKNSESESFLAQNGLEDGALYVWVPTDAAVDSPAEFNGTGNSEAGAWVEIDNTPVIENASEDGSTGFDEYGYPTQRTLWSRAEAVGAFGFSRPEDLATNPNDGSEFVLASTGVDTFDGGVDTFGTMYTMDVDFTDINAPTGTLNILYDGDADATRALRSPDNLDWADDGFIYVQEDEAEEAAPDGEVLFGEGAANPNEAGIVRIDPADGSITRVANIDRSVVLDPSTGGTPVDTDAGAAGEWESSGILDVSTLFGEAPGSLFLYDVQAHGIVDQEDVNADSRISDGDLVEGGQLGFLSAPRSLDVGAIEGFDSLQSVAVKNGVVAVAVSRAPVDTTVFGTEVALSQPGFVALFDAASLELISTVDVGNLPDQLTFSEDGSVLLVAGEGEKNDDSDNDDNPLGTVAIVDVSDPANPSANIVDFTLFNGLEEQAREAGLRIQEGVSLATDLEPEYITISPDGTTAYVALQENNAIASIDIASGNVIDIFGLGTTDFSQVAFDPLDDGIIDIRTVDNVVGFRMPDAIVAAELGGETFILTANEGDSRDFDEDRVADLVADGLLDDALVADLLAKGLIDNDDDTDVGIERLEVSTIDGDTDGDGDIDVIHSFSSRSFSIFDEDGGLVFDSGSEFEQIIAEVAPERFNDDDGDDGEDRSDAKGPEPEAIEVGEVGGRMYAFIGLERDSGIMIYNIEDPANAFFVDYIPPLHVDNAADGEIARHAPEVIEFIPAEESGTGSAQIAVSYEVSGSTIVYDLDAIDPLVTIMDVQGAGHVSEFVGETVTVVGVVTAVDFNGYYMQDPEGDGDDATSDGIFVFTGNGVAQGLVSVGDEVEVTGGVSEFIPGGAGTGNLSITQISSSEATVLSTGNIIASTVIGAAGRTPPTEVVISPEETPVNLQDEAGTFNPETDGIDFYESLEGMLVTVDNPVAIAATNRFDETWVVADDGAGVTSGSPTGGLNDRGALVINADVDGLGDLNPERIQIQYDSFFDLLPEGFTPPDINIGDDLSDITGVVGYAFGNFEINVTAEFLVETPTANVAEVTDISSGGDRLTVATYNVLNLTSNFASGDDDDEDAAQMAALGAEIAVNLGSPDIVALQEIQDNSGVNFNAADGVLDADETLQALVDSIAAAGGPNYTFVSAVVDVEGENGGVPGGNIRNAFLVNEERISINEVVTLESDVLAGFGVTNADAFLGSRDPLMGSFEFNGQDITLINNHFSSRFGSEPVFGGPQPFNQGGEAAREQQALTINEVVDALLAVDPNAKVSVLGDLNTFEFTDELAEDLPGVGEEQVLTNLIGNIAEDDAYSFVFQGNAQMLDHVFATDSLLDGAEIDVVHVNNDFAEFSSDHEPIVVSYDFFVEGLEIVGTPDEDFSLTGGAGDDTITGLASNDTLNGLAGSDTLDGGEGDDTMSGGEGDDIYVVDSIGDVVIEGTDEGSDVIGASVSLTLPENVEIGILVGADDLTLIGSEGADSLFGNTGDNLIQGLGEDDFLFAQSGNDTLEGGQGNDTLNGGAGEDIFVAGPANGDDIIEDFEIGVDVLDLDVLGLRFADLELTSDGSDALITFDDPAGGTSSFRLQNTDAEALEIDLVVDPGGVGSPGGIPLLAGTSAGENLAGTAAAEDLIGLAGDDSLNGRAGDDTMLGGFGDDRYFFDDAGDIAIEFEDQGIDQIDTRFSITLSDNVEKGAVRGGGAVDITGNELDNFITGSALTNVLSGGAGNDRLISRAGDDTLNGGLDNDVLEGGADADIFQFDADSGIDQILDFSLAEDQIDVLALGLAFSDLDIVDSAFGAKVTFDAATDGANFAFLRGVTAANLDDTHFRTTDDAVPSVGSFDDDVMLFS